jgi:ATP-dependent DNA helicase RecG
MNLADLLSQGESEIVEFKASFNQALGLSNRQLQLIAFIRQHGKITNRDYRELAGLSDETARKEIQQLRDHGVLETVGKGRSTAYVLRRRVGG